MRLVLIFVAALVANTAALAGVQEDAQSAKVRRSISPPMAPLIGKMSLTMGLSYSPDLGYVILRERPDLSAVIAQTTKMLGKGPEDAPIYTRLGALYRAEGDFASAQSAYRRSHDFYRVLLARHPSDGSLIAAYSLTLLRLGQSGQAEATLRYAGKNNAEVQTALGRVLEEQAAAWLEGATTPPHADNAQTALDEAATCFDRATCLTPNSPSVWAIRGGFRTFIRAQMQAHIDTLRSKHSTTSGMMVSPEGLTDYERAARLSPQDPYAVAMPVWLDIAYFAVTHHAAMVDRKNIPLMSPQTRQRARDTISRLKVLTQAKDKRLAAQAWTALAWVQFEFYDDGPGAIRSLLQALKDDRSRQDAADYLLHVAAVVHNYPLLAALCRHESSRDHSTRLHLILAYADVKISEYEEAKRQLEAAHQQDREDFDIRLALTALLMKTGRPADLARAGELTEQSADALPPTATPGQVAEYEALRGVFCALREQPEQARNLLRLALKTDPANPQAKDALAALAAAGR